MPKPIFEAGFGWVALAFVVALASVIGIAHWARRRHEATGQPFHTVYAAWACWSVCRSWRFC